MMAYLTRFIRTGDPADGDAGLPAWTPWSEAEGAAKRMVLDAGGPAPSARLAGH